jgi:methyl-accepting chemotaxis protein
VRELAQRSAKAAKEIKTLITASGAHVASGVALVTNAGSALQEIASQVQEINTNVSAIVDSAREQSTALSEINQAINTVDQGTQQNAAMVEEQTAASHGLAREAAALFELLGQFRFDEASRPAASSKQNRQQLLEPVAARPNRQRPSLSVSRGSTALATQSHWEDF